MTSLLESSRRGQVTLLEVVPCHQAQCLESRMECLMAAIAESDDEAKMRVNAFLEKRTSKAADRSEAAPPLPARSAGTGE
jgi:hypothetical protein